MTCCKLTLVLRAKAFVLTFGLLRSVACSVLPDAQSSSGTTPAETGNSGVSGTAGAAASSGQRPELLLNPSELAKLVNPESAGIDIIRQLAHALHLCGKKETPSMRRVFFKNTTITCNDGTQAGYYIRKSPESQRWIIFLEGGWYCFDRKSCDNRWLRMRNLMTSASWPETKDVGGILSPDAEENPYWWNANHVFVPYCSSDTWSGLATSGDDYVFMGSLIVQEVIRDLLTRGLYDASFLLLAGSSAGGTGVLLNLDRVADMLKEVGSEVEVRGLADSGWFLDNEPYEPVECVDPHTCAPLEAIKQGIKLWNGQIPERCKIHYPPSEHWRCYFGYRIYPSLKAPLFVFQWLFDEAQMTADNVGPPVTKAQWDYIHKMGVELKSTLHNVTAVFAPSCISHIVLTKRDWRHIRINEISLPEALRCWELQSHEHNHHEHHPHHHLHDAKEPDVENSETNSTSLSTSAMLSDMPAASIRARHLVRSGEIPPFPSGDVHTDEEGDDGAKEQDDTNKDRRHRKRRTRKRKRQNKEHKNQKNKKKKNKKNHARNRDKRSLFLEDIHLRHVWSHHEDLCHHWLIEECSWPQCNRACPRLHNPFTGEEMDFIELLKSFGLDMSSVANALGIDLATLNEMDHDTLLQLLTQQTNK